MVLYIEYVLADNFLVDFVLLNLTSKIVRERPRWWLVLLACAFGSAGAFVLPLFSLPIAASIAIKLAIGIIMCAICFAKAAMFVKFVAFLMLLVCTYALGGMTIAFIFLFTRNPLETFSASYRGTLPIGTLIFGLFCLISGGLYLVRYIQERRAIAPFLRNIKLILFGKTISLFGYLDSGNRLEDNQSGLPIVVVSKFSIEKHFKKGVLKDNLSEREKKKLNPHYIEAKSATGNGKMLILSPEYIEIGNQKKSALIGISNTKFSEIVSIDALFGPALA